MGKKRIIKKSGSGGDAGKRGPVRLARKKLERGVLFINASFNNTMVTLADTDGQAVTWSSAGALGFRGARKATPFAAAKVGEAIGERAKTLGVKDIEVIIKGIGSGRESAIRGFLSTSGAGLAMIQDRTPVPWGGVRPPKPRRV